MVYILFLVILFFIAVSPLFRLILSKLHLIGIYSVIDAYKYIKYQKWREFDLYGIDMFIGMFGHGKTLSMTHQARRIYEHFGDRVRFISNYELYDIPYIPLINFNQLVDIGEEDDNKYIGTVVLIDEIENVLSHRNFANFPLSMLHMLTQQRKKRVYIMASAQRFFMVDKLFRSLTTNVIDCNKYWRFQHLCVYDAWDLEQAMNKDLVKRLGNKWFFVKNQDYNCYSTESMVKKGTAEDFISNDKALIAKGLDMMSNENAIVHKSRSYKKKKK